MKESKMNTNKIECPKCNNTATVTTPGTLALGLVLSGSFVTIVSLFIPVLGWVMFPVAAALTLLSLIAAPFITIFGGVTISCKHCNKKFTMNKKEYKKYLEKF